jgi:hypothetical protein
VCGMSFPSLASISFASTVWASPVAGPGYEAAGSFSALCSSKAPGSLERSPFQVWPAGWGDQRSRLTKLSRGRRVRLPATAHTRSRPRGAAGRAVPPHTRTSSTKTTRWPRGSPATPPGWTPSGRHPSGRSFSAAPAAERGPAAGTCCWATHSDRPQAHERTSARAAAVRCYTSSAAKPTVGGSSRRDTRKSRKILLRDTVEFSAASSHSAVRWNQRTSRG